MHAGWNFADISFYSFLKKNEREKSGDHLVLPHTTLTKLATWGKAVSVEINRPCPFLTLSSLSPWQPKLTEEHRKVNEHRHGEKLESVARKEIEF